MSIEFDTSFLTTNTNRDHQPDANSVSNASIQAQDGSETSLSSEPGTPVPSSAYPAFLGAPPTDNLPGNNHSASGDTLHANQHQTPPTTHLEHESSGKQHDDGSKVQVRIELMVRHDIF